MPRLRELRERSIGAIASLHVWTGVCRLLGGSSCTYIQHHHLEGGSSGWRMDGGACFFRGPWLVRHGTVGPMAGHLGSTLVGDL